MHYVTFWKNLQVVAGLEKLAASNDELVAVQAQPLLAQACDEVFSAVKKASAEFRHNLRYEGLPSVAEQVTESVWRLRKDHRLTGEKFASSPDETAEFLEKLIVATYVDDALSTQLEKLSGEEYDAARRVQMLGREYAVNLMRGLFA